MLGYNLSMATMPQYDVLREMTLTGLPLPITVRPPVAISDDDLLELSRRNETLHIERNAKGELEIMSPAGGEGSRLESRVIRELDFWTEEHGGASFSSSAGFHLPDGSVMSPDAAWISEARWATLTKKERRKYPPLCPDFIVEVLSETHSRRVAEAKMQLWMENGALLAWMIDPGRCTVSIYRPGQRVEELLRPDLIEASEPVSGFRVNMLKLWDR